MVITSDGRSVPCCFDKRAAYVLGDTGEQSIAGIWKSNAYRDFRKQVLTNRGEIEICSNCTEGIGKIYHKGPERPENFTGRSRLGTRRS